MALSLIERLAELADPRDRRGLRYPLPAVLALCFVAALAGHTSLAAISQFGRLRRHRLAHALGFRNRNIPAPSALSELLRDLDADHLDRIIGAWLAERHAGGWSVVAIDGKTLRGSRNGERPGTHLLAAYAPQAAATIAQMTVAATTNEHKAALRLLGIVPGLAGAVVTADAMFTHRDFYETVLEKQGDYLLYAKDNQEQLQEAIAETFAAAKDFSPHQQSQWHDDVQTATTRDKGHGRIEVRTLASTTWLNRYLDWPSLGQVFRLERVRRVQGQASVEVVYGITSLPRHRADAARLLELTRTHWAIENELHYVRDVTLGEDRCRVRCGAAPRVLASVRNGAIAILNDVESPSRAAAIREFCAEPELCLHYFGLQRPNTE